MARSKAKRYTKKRVNWALRILLVALFAFVAVKGIQLCSELMDTHQQLQQIAESNAKKEASNESKEQQKQDVEGILEYNANESGQYLPGQQIYQNAG